MQNWVQVLPPWSIIPSGREDTSPVVSDDTQGENSTLRRAGALFTFLTSVTKLTKQSQEGEVCLGSQFGSVAMAAVLVSVLWVDTMATATLIKKNI